MKKTRKRERRLQVGDAVLVWRKAAGAGNFLAACGPLGGLYTVLLFAPSPKIKKTRNKTT